MFLSRFFKLHYLPGITCSWFIITFTITYFISIENGHVYPYFPFISDTGTTPPESCIFSEMLFIAAALTALIGYVRYRQVDFAITTDDIPIRKIWNILGILSGYVCSLGITIVASFQETIMLPVHLLGALMIFGSGSLYLFIQTRITFSFRHAYRKNPNYWIGTKTLCSRIFLAICFILLYCCVAGFGFFSLMEFEEDISKIPWWTEEHKGYDLHLVSTIAEWLMVAIFLLYLCTFTREFKSLEYKEIAFEMVTTNKPTDKEQQTP